MHCLSSPLRLPSVCQVRGPEYRCRTTSLLALKLKKVDAVVRAYKLGVVCSLKERGYEQAISHIVPRKARAISSEPGCYNVQQSITINELELQR